ncbi:MAG: ATP-grasp domain-containing protein [Gemmatimonadales bacterium]
MTALRVLILDGQTTQALACARSLGRAGHAVVVAGGQRWPLAGWSRYAAGRFRVAQESLAGFADVRAWAQREGVSLVLPMTERACLLCNAEREAWEAAGITLGCAADAQLLRAFDKTQTIRAAEACGVALPPTWLPTSNAECLAAVEALGFPCVIKSRFSDVLVGSAVLHGGGVSYVNRLADLEPAIRKHRQGPHWPIIQGFVGGVGKGVSGLSDHGRPVALVAHERLRDVRPSGSGSSLRRSIPLDSRLRLPVERLLAQLQWHGPVMVEFRDDGGERPVLMEVNGRFWGSIQLAILAGIDVPRWWVSMLDEEPVSPTVAAEGVTVRWLWGDVRRFLRILAGPPRGYPGRYPTRWQGIKELLGPQPQGTRLETWDPSDPWPAVGEWVQGVGELAGQGLQWVRKNRAQGAVNFFPRRNRQVPAEGGHQVERANV